MSFSCTLGLATSPDLTTCLTQLKTTTLVICVALYSDRLLWRENYLATYDRVKDEVLQDKVGGKAKEAFGTVTGDDSKKNEGKAQNLSGKVMCSFAHTLVHTFIFSYGVLWL